MASREERAKCAKCGFENPPNAKFCSNCGAKLVRAVERHFEASALLLAVGSAYLIVSLAVNVIYQVSVFAVISIVSIASGLYGAYRLYHGKPSRGSLISSVIAIISGLAVTLWVFALGLGIRGVFGPGWVIFVAAGLKLWADWRSRPR
jgi:uncharacterized protein (DUF983 family)